MATTAELWAKLRIDGLIRSELDGGLAKSSIGITDRLVMPGGSLAGEVDLIWADERTIDGVEILNLSDALVDSGQGAGRDSLGALAGFSDVALVYIENDGPGDFRWGTDGSFAGPFVPSSGTMRVQAGSFALVATLGAEWSMPTFSGLFAGSVAGGDAVTYRMLVAGRRS